MRTIGNDQKNNGQNFWEILERTIGKISSIIGAGLIFSLYLAKNFSLLRPLSHVLYQWQWPLIGTEKQQGLSNQSYKV